ncbi:MAG: N-formylglutamate amidohydrolase [Hyphomonas sp.]|uniref:N-formylglutamate amidohydrolase n=1 Tax=Hyphomonas sp. TaxID=87 RepID=UPI0034A0A78C
MRETSPAVRLDPLPEPLQVTGPALSEPPFDHTPAAALASPVLFASPHSGSHYPAAMQDALCVPLIDVRRTEDAFIDELFAGAPALGAGLVAARYGRSVVDLNRDPHELDAAMFRDGPPRPCALPTARVDTGLGCLPRVGARGEAIYARLLTRAEGEERLTHVHDAYHLHLSGELDALRRAHGHALLIDCHSMPSLQPGRHMLTDIVLGDRFGSSADPRLMYRIERSFRAQGFTVARNAPYAGGYTTRRYGRPRRGIHALQVEINRGLYMDEQRITRASGFSALKGALQEVMAEIIDAARLLPRA